MKKARDFRRGAGYRHVIYNGFLSERSIGDEVIPLTPENYLVMKLLFEAESSVLFKYGLSLKLAKEWTTLMAQGIVPCEKQTMKEFEGYVLQIIESHENRNKAEQ